jgi:hypothetical protein
MSQAMQSSNPMRKGIILFLFLAHSYLALLIVSLGEQATQSREPMRIGAFPFFLPHAFLPSTSHWFAR